MENVFITKNFKKIYITLLVIIYVVFATCIVFFSKENIILYLFYALTSLSFFAILGVGIWKFLVKQNRPKNLVLSIFTYLIAGIFVIGMWIIFNFISYNIFREIFQIDFMNFFIFPQIVFGMFFYLILIMFFYLILLFSKYHEKLVIEENTQKLLVESRLNMLKAYINPHFLFNCLNSVNALITIDPEIAREMLVNMADYFRYSLKNKDKQFVLFSEEYENALLYLEIEKIRFYNRINVDFQIDEKANNIYVPVMILQPLFENVIKHAVSKTTDVVNVQLIISVKSYLEIIMRNNYDNSYVSKDSIGIGLSSIVERLNLLYYKNDLVEIIKSAEEFKIILKIPINTEKI
ncbi:MAG: histidine kinase, partial [Bacteroidales bacterium]|jgi:sensor histidine kinase YesM|nr:histidine kinase [Bacteroidales bacterium]